MDVPKRACPFFKNAIRKFFIYLAYFDFVVIDNIKKEAAATANKVRQSILEQGELDIERLAATGKASIANAENQIRKQIQQQIAALALKRVVLQLKEEMTSDMQSKIIDNNIQKLGGQL